MKLAVIIPVHTHAPVAELTIGSFIRTHREHDLNIHVGVHANYADYTQDLSLFDHLRGVAQVHCVDEIDWREHNANWFRYSLMHAKNVVNLLRNVRHYTFDYLVLLDHDLFVKREFVGECVDVPGPRVDLVGSPFEDRLGLNRIKTRGGGELIYAAPKVSAWHLVLSRALFDRIMERPEVIYPKFLRGDERREYLEAHGADEDLPVFVDTFAEVFHRLEREWGMRPRLLSRVEFDERVMHYYGTSFNYGEWVLQAVYPGHVAEIVETYRREFPEGLSPDLFSAMARREGGEQDFDRR